jgi:hypothetical protein
MTALEVLSEAHERGLVLSARGDQLAVAPNRLLSPDFKGKLREFKPGLLPLLQTKGITWIEVHSERLGETIFFCEDERTKEALVEAGAEPWSVYTRAELQILVTQNRVAPLTDTELRKVHQIKRTFNARIRVKRCHWSPSFFWKSKGSPVLTFVITDASARFSFRKFTYPSGSSIMPQNSGTSANPRNSRGTASSPFPSDGDDDPLDGLAVVAGCLSAAGAEKHKSIVHMTIAKEVKHDLIVPLRALFSTSDAP